MKKLNLSKIINQIVYFIAFFLVFYCILLEVYKLLEFILEYYSFSFSDLISNVNDNSSKGAENKPSGVSVDRPYSKFPSGVAQVGSILGAASLAGRKTPGGPLAKGVASVATGILAGAYLTFTHGVEHPNGFNNALDKVGSIFGKGNSTNDPTNIANRSSSNNISKFMSDDNSNPLDNILLEAIIILSIEPRHILVYGPYYFTTHPIVLNLPLV